MSHTRRATLSERLLLCLNRNTNLSAGHIHPWINETCPWNSLTALTHISPLGSLSSPRREFQVRTGEFYSSCSPAVLPHGVPLPWPCTHSEASAECHLLLFSRRRHWELVSRLWAKNKAQLDVPDKEPFCSRMWSSPRQVSIA